MKSLPESIQFKVCSKCKAEKPFSEFHKCKSNKDGLQCKCIECRRDSWTLPDSRKAKINKQLLRDQNLKRCGKCHEIKCVDSFSVSSRAVDCGLKSTCRDCISKDYSENRDKVLKRVGQYRNNNKEKIADTNKKYGEKNREKISNKNKEYRSKNRKEVNDRKNASLKKRSKSKVLFSQLPITDNPSFNIQGYITVSCYFCHKRFAPTTGALNTRINCLKGNLPGEGNFYHSEECKQNCPTFKFQPYKQIDPRSTLYVPKTEAQQARAAQTDELKKNQCDKYGYNFCERCGDIVDVELHHTLPVAQYGLRAINSDSHILLCPGCHVALHGECV